MVNIVKLTVFFSIGYSGSLLCRVVQKNLVFVVGLSPRLCDAEILRRHEYFGKFGKIHKVVINQSTSYVGSQVRTVVFLIYLECSIALTVLRRYEKVPRQRCCWQHMDSPA